MSYTYSPLFSGQFSFWDPSFSHFCSPASFVTYFFGRAGWWLDAIGVKCSDGAVIGPTPGPGGIPVYDACPSGFTQINVTAGSSYYIGSLDPECNGVTLQMEGLGWGKGKGLNQTFTCPTNSIIRGILGVAGAFVDSIQFACA
jgi:hypothetical protein